MPDFIYAIDVCDVPPGKSVPVEIDDHWYAVCNDSGTIHVADNLCPHAGGPLGKGDVHDGHVVCPVHYWHFDLTTGASDANTPHLKLKIYRCEIRNGKVYVDISGPVPTE